MFACSLKFLSVSVTLSKSFNILCSCIPIAQMLYSSYIVVCYAYYTTVRYPYTAPCAPLQIVSLLVSSPYFSPLYSSSHFISFGWLSIHTHVDDHYFQCTIFTTASELFPSDFNRGWSPTEAVNMIDMCHSTNRSIPSGYASRTKISHPVFTVS